MFGLNDKDKQDENQMSPPSLVTKSTADLPDGLGGAGHSDVQPAPSATMPPIAAGPIDPTVPGYHLQGSAQLSAPALPDSGSSDVNQTVHAPPPQLGGSTEDEMLKMKHQALQNLAPLVDQLDQTPEEKFRITMMLLQASDNPELVKEAYAAANEIKDEKARAQALLDVVNEINYFTQPKNGA